MSKAEEIIRELNLQPHPREDGFFVETYRAKARVSWEALSGRYDGTRCLSTAIYFLLTDRGFSEMHRLRSDEIFHYYAGAPAEMLQLHPDGSGKLLLLGNDFAAGHRPQILVPANVWQGTRTMGEYTLFGCTVAPGFEYSDYQSGQREKLQASYPQYAEKIRSLTR